MDRRQRAAEPEPVPGRDIAFGDRNEAGQPCLGCEEVIAVRVESAVGDPITDREKLAAGLEEEVELHRFEHRRRAFGKRGQSPLERCRGAARGRERPGQGVQHCRRGGGTVRVLRGGLLVVTAGLADMRQFAQARHGAEWVGAPVRGDVSFAACVGIERPGQQFAEIPQMAANGGVNGFRPDQRLCAFPVAAPLAQRPRDVGDRVG